MAYFLAFFLCFSSLAKDTYSIPQDIIKARDEALESWDELHSYIILRYMELSEKDKLSKEEAQELFALEKIIRYRVYGEPLPTKSKE